MSLMSTMIGVAERVPLPDVLVRAAIERMCARTAAALSEQGPAKAAEICRGGRRTCCRRTRGRSEQTALRGAGRVFRARFGAEAEIYSCCYHTIPGSTLGEAETSALAQTIAHAELTDGQTILELGCCWGRYRSISRGNSRIWR